MAEGESAAKHLLNISECGIACARGIAQKRPDSTINQQHQPTKVEADRNTTVSLLLTENHNIKQGWPS